MKTLNFHNKMKLIVDGMIKIPLDKNRILNLTELTNNKNMKPKNMLKIKIIQSSRHQYV